MKKLFCGAILAAAVVHPAVAQEETASDLARDGLRIEARATYETPTTSSVFEEDDIYKLGSAVAFGGEAGFDIAVGERVTFGPYGQYEISNVESCEDGFCARTTDYLEAGIQVGYAVGTNGQLYGKVGYGRLGFETEGNGFNTTEDGSGVAFALGYELGLGEHLYGRIEGGYADVGEVYGLNFQRRHFGVALGARF